MAVICRGSLFDHVWMDGLAATASGGLVRNIAGSGPADRKHEARLRH